MLCGAVFGLLCVEEPPDIFSAGLKLTRSGSSVNSPVTPNSSWLSRCLVWSKKAGLEHAWIDFILMIEL